MTTLVFDIETNGLLDELDTVHSLVIRDVDTGEVWSWANRNGFIHSEIIQGLDQLRDADTIIGHNIIAFDIPALQKVYPKWKPKGTIRDTLVLARVLWPDIKVADRHRVEKKTMPRNMVGRYSLESFGHRLGNHKGSFNGPWDTWTEEMQTYGEQDVAVTVDLWNTIQERLEAYRNHDFVELEHQVAAIIFRQERRGFAFDAEGAASLYSQLVRRRSQIEEELSRVFKPWYRPTGTFTPKRDLKRLGYVAGAPMTKVERTTFNPGSRDHIADRLKALRGWVPNEFTDGGKPKVDETVLSQLPYPEAKLLAEYLLIFKRISTLAEGNGALLKVERNGRIHGRVISNGAVTGRMTHMKPNINIPTNRAPYGKQMRALFRTTPGMKLVGADADALELRCLAHFMAPFDDGEYVRAVTQGEKSEGTDNHSMNARVLGLDPKTLYDQDARQETGREIAKRWFYAFIYGAGKWKLGFIWGHRGSRNKVARSGAKDHKNLLAGLPALKKLIEAVHAKVDQFGLLMGLDGRSVPSRSKHSSLNTLLQSAGAVIMKRALVILDRALQDMGLVPGRDYEFVANVHDEWQIETLPELTETVGEAANEAITQAGLYYGFRCPLVGQYGVGNNWSETH